MTAASLFVPSTKDFFTMCGCNVTFGPLTHDFDESAIPHAFRGNLGGRSGPPVNAFGSDGFSGLNQFGSGSNPPVAWQPFEIDLATKRVDAHDSYAHIVAEAEFFAVAAPFDHVFFFVVVIIIVSQ